MLTLSSTLKYRYLHVMIFTLVALSIPGLGKANASAIMLEDSVNTSNISTDFKLQVTATSNHQSIDGKGKKSLFIKNVVIRQGSLELKANQVELDQTRGKKNEIITATGSPASYKQRLENGTWVEAKADEIRYLVAERTLALTGNATIEQNTVQVEGDSILFDMAKEQIVAQSDNNSDSQVTTVISPGAFEEQNNN